LFCASLYWRIVLLIFRQMIENQSDNIDIKENDVSNQDNAPDDN